MLISTLFFLIFSGLFSQSLIKISGNHIVQLQQLSSAYEAKTTLNMSKEILKQKVEREEIPKEGSIVTSAGTVLIEREEISSEYIFTLTLTTNKRGQYSDEFVVALPEEEDTEVNEEEAEEKEEQEMGKQVDKKQAPSKEKTEEILKNSEGKDEQDLKKEMVE